MSEEGLQAAVLREGIIVLWVVLPHIRRDVRELEAAAERTLQVGESVAVAKHHLPGNVPPVVPRITTYFALIHRHGSGQPPQGGSLPHLSMAEFHREMRDTSGKGEP